MAYPCRIFIYVFTISYLYLIKVKSRNFDNLERACGGINNFHAGEAPIFFDYHVACMMLSYWLSIWDYQVFMYQVLLF